MSHAAIATACSFTQRQVQYALTGPLTPQKSKPKSWCYRVSDELLEQLRDFLAEDPAYRDIARQDIRFFVSGFEGIELL